MGRVLVPRIKSQKTIGKVRIRPQISCLKLCRREPARSGLAEKLVVQVDADHTSPTRDELGDLVTDPAPEIKNAHPFQWWQ